MARSAYNYTLAETHKGKVYIPYVGIEVKGYTTLFSAVLGFFTVTAVISSLGNTVRLCLKNMDFLSFFLC